jgi:hypothetical protein
MVANGFKARDNLLKIMNGEPDPSTAAEYRSAHLSPSCLVDDVPTFSLEESCFKSSQLNFVRAYTGLSILREGVFFAADYIAPTMKL